jgi:hypothetical protein
LVTAGTITGPLDEILVKLDGHGSASDGHIQTLARSTDGITNLQARDDNEVEALGDQREQRLLGCSAERAISLKVSGVGSSISSAPA